jgi:large subunit ribosomal protein L5
MWSFYTRLVHIALPRTRDFQGLSPDSFDGRGNYSIGLREQLIFPEIDKIRGMEVNIVTTAKTDEEGRSLLAQLGMPFRRP